MNVPALPWQPHIPTLAWTIGLVGVAILGIWIWLAWRRAQEE